MATHSFPVPNYLISICKWLSARKKLNKATNSSLHIYINVGSCIWGTICKYENGRYSWPEMSLILGRSGTQYVAMVTKLLNSNCGAHLVESYCKESSISVTNWLKYLLSSYLFKIWLSVWLHNLPNLRILKTWISLEQREIFEKN